MDNLKKKLQDFVIECTIELRDLSNEVSLTEFNRLYSEAHKCYIDKATPVLTKYIDENPEHTNMAIDEFNIYFSNLRRLYKPPETHEN